MAAVGVIRVAVRTVLAGTVGIACAGLPTAGTTSAGAEVIDDYEGPWSVTIVSDREDAFDDASLFLGPGASDLFIGDKGSALYFEVTDSSDPLDQIEISIAAEDDLHEGFDRSQLSFNDPEAFYLDFTGTVGVSDNGSSCPVDQAHVDIRELHRSNGVVDRLWVLFEQRCRGAPRALFGEIRIGLSPAPIEVIPRVIRWPATEVVGGSGKAVPVRVTAESGVLGEVTASILGRDRGSFEITDSTCTDPTSSECQLSVVYHAQHPGVASGRLLMETPLGTQSVPLSGFTAASTNRLVMHSDAGDYLGDGRDYFLDAAGRYGVIAYGSRTRVYAAAEEGGWNISLEPPDGKTLRTGVYRNTAKSSVNHAGPVMRISGDGRGCGYSHGQFEIFQVRYAAPGRLAAIDFKFVHYCESSGAALKGRYRWNARRDWRGPAKVTNISAARSGGRWELNWTNPSDPDFARTEVRWYHGATKPSQIPDAGWPALRPTPRSAVIDPFRKGPLTVSIYPIDRDGNVGTVRAIILR